MEENGVAPGELLPPENDLAKEFGVRRPTVRRALESLAGRASSRSSAARERR